jgi:hypothetical protein
MWLIEHGIDIRCVRMKPHTDGARVFVDVQQVLPLPEASDYFVNLREKKEEERQSRRRESEWRGLWFVRVILTTCDGQPRHDFVVLSSTDEYRQLTRSRLRPCAAGTQSHAIRMLVVVSQVQR